MSRFLFTFSCFSLRISPSKAEEYTALTCDDQSLVVSAPSNFAIERKPITSKPNTRLLPKKPCFYKKYPRSVCMPRFDLRQRADPSVFFPFKTQSRRNWIDRLMEREKIESVGKSLDQIVQNTPWLFETSFCQGVEKIL